MNRELRLQVRAMRTEGKSLNEIARLTSVSKSTISNWVRDIELTTVQYEELKRNQHRYAAQNKGAQANRSNARDLRIASQESGRQHARTGSPLFLAGCMLYWSEGAKARNKVQFVNSDPHMVQFFLRFLREEFRIADTVIKLHIQCHQQSPEAVARIEQYWLQLLSLSPDCLGKTHIKVGSASRHNHLVNGICALTVCSTELVQHIYGAIQEYGGFEKPEWLG